ncbi:MAG: hypothetical protein GY714_20315 [Desulfobacterales bacterium]|nr:hypothetical protein [Desulfobacterales bacterium]
MAGEIVRQSYQEYGPDIRTITFDCLCDAGDGSIADTALTDDMYKRVQGWSLDSVESVPGGTAPDAADVVINDEHGLDVLGGNGTGLIHATDTKATIPNIDSQNKRIPMKGKLTLSVANQATVSATYLIILTFVRMV